MRMTRDVLQYVLAAGLLALAVTVISLGIRRPGRQRATLAWAVSLMALVSGFGVIGRADDYRHHIFLALIVVTFLAAGFALLRFRDSFLPVARIWKVAAAAILVGAGIFELIVKVPLRAGETWSFVQKLSVVLVIGAWLTVVAEPAVRFWIASREHPRVQRLRLRSLSIAYGLIVVLFVADTASFVGGNDALAVTSGALALLLIPMLYAGLLPPAWLRRLWRRKEEQELALTRGLVQFARDRTELARRALDWAMRLVGGRAGALFDGEGVLLASADLEEDEARKFVSVARSDEASILREEGGRQLAIAVPIVHEHGRGQLLVLSGPFTLIFGSDEVASLEQHAEVIGFALDRVALTETRRKLEETKTQFLANAAHELRTPLASIVGFSELFAEGLERMSPENVQEGLGAIIRQGRRMSLLINDLLDLTQLELGRARIDLKPLLLRPAVEQSVANASPPSGRRVRIDVGASTSVLADPTRLDQVFTNLLTNAFRYGGENVAIEAIPQNGSVLVVIADDGGGVPADLEPHLFEPFSRGNTSREGSGLGLAIVRSLVEAFGGTVSYEPGVPRGARFVVQLVGAD